MVVMAAGRRDGAGRLERLGSTAGALCHCLNGLHASGLRALSRVLHAASEQVVQVEASSACSRDLGQRMRGGPVSSLHM